MSLLFFDIGVRNKRLIFLFLFLFITSSSWATHLRAGEITLQLIDCFSLRYKVTLTLYTDLGSDVRPGGGEIDFGDGSPKYPFHTRAPDFFEDLGDLVGHNIFYTEHTFPGPGVYIIRYMEHNRNGDVANMDNSVNTSFYIETKLIIDPYFGCNNTPILLNPPIDKACIGRTFFHNPGAYDIDGDSLSYEIVVNKQDVDLPVANYSFPNVYDLHTTTNASTEDNSGPPVYSLDPVTGNLTWNAPAQEGEYNIAFLIKEWRFIAATSEWVLMGYITRDMQIIVMQCDNQRPEVSIPKDTCIEAGTLLTAVISASDPDNDSLVISAFGGPFQKLPIASYSPLPEDPVNPQPQPAIINFRWQTSCNHVQKRPYQITFKVKDDPPKGKGAALVDFKNWFITIVAPAPKGLTAQYIQGRKVKLSWDQYKCESNATSMQIWRRVDNYPISQGSCDTGMPAEAGYTLIDNIGIDTTVFIDNNAGKGLAYGATYCYRIVAQFPLPSGGESHVSDEVCITINQDQNRFGPVITKVSISKTDISNGEIDLQWTSPFEADLNLFPRPYHYHLYRAIEGNHNMEEAEDYSVIDTIFTDSGLNTENNIYIYKVLAYDNNNQIIDTSAWASSVRLSSKPIVNKITLTWDADVPWSNNTIEYPYHYLYRNRVNENDPEALILIDSINVNLDGFRYLDSGQINNLTLDKDILYCYYVTTQGSYGNPVITEPLKNNSQIMCNQPNDTVPPCKVDENTITINKDIDCKTFVSDKPCDFNNYFHTLTWQMPVGLNCDDDIRGYEIWFSKSGNENDFNLLTTVNITNYTHEGISSFAGCYKIRAVDRSGNYGEFSDKICYENCPIYELPNVFTPNDDGQNDLFTAFSFPYSKCPRFIKSVDFRVYNRWGSEIYHSGINGESSIYIEWNGRTYEGKIADPGVYYFVAKVYYDNISEATQSSILKGWIQILR